MVNRVFLVLTLALLLIFAGCFDEHKETDNSAGVDKESVKLSKSAENKTESGSNEQELCEEECHDTCGTSEGITPGFISHNKCVDGTCQYHYATYCEYGTETCSERGDGIGKCIPLEGKKKQMVLILSAPSINNEYYAEHFNEIVDFQIHYANKVLEHNADTIRILVDSDTKPFYKDLPDEVIIIEEMYDIWMRDFTTVNPEHPVQFVYTDASMNTNQAKETQHQFSKFADGYDLNRKYTGLVLDGGNIVDNYDGKIITTTRFLEDNNLEFEDGKNVLKELLHAKQVAIIEPDDEVLAHSDGMVAWIDDDVLAVNDYSTIDPEFDFLVIEELESSFPNVQILKVPVSFDETGGVDTTKGIGSACGVNLNLVATYDTLYIPVFGTALDDQVIEMIRKNTSKNIVEIDARTICLFGGSVRCTTWQLAGENAQRIIDKG